MGAWRKQLAMQNQGAGAMWYLKAIQHHPTGSQLRNMHRKARNFPEQTIQQNAINT